MRRISSKPGEAALIGALLAALSPAVAQQADRGARYPLSLANPAPKDAVRNGPLFKLVKGKGSYAELLPILTKDVSLVAGTKGGKFTNAADIEKFYSAVVKDCKGPFSIDEGKWPSGDRAPWVQTSWVCHTARELPITAYFDFKFSPEIGLEFGFAGGKVKSIMALELTPIPGRRMLKMDAADTMSATNG